MDRRRFLSSGAAVAATLSGPRSAVAQTQPIVELRTLLAGLLQSKNVPSASFAIIDGGRISSGVVGVRAPGAALVTPQTVYQAASDSKMIAAIVGVILAQRRTVDLDGDLTATLRSLNVPLSPAAASASQKVTLRRLFGMTAGANVHGFGGYPSGAPLPTLAQILAGTRPANSPRVRIGIAPGSRYAYSGGGFEIARAVLARTSGQGFNALAQQLVLGPLQMQRSSYYQPIAIGGITNVALGHNAAGKTMPGKWHLFPELAAAGLWTTPSDLARFAVALSDSYHGRSNALLSQRWAQQVFTHVDALRYGIGAALVNRSGVVSYVKGGVNVGYRSYLILFPASGQGAAIMANSDNGEALFAPFYRHVVSLYGWPYFPGLVD
jgi:CubicO group peptidase (beta-lactamase class C family)